MRLAIITTHPIQYYAPVFKLLNQAQNMEVKVFYTWEEAAREKYDPGFGKQIQWDVPLLDGYPFEWVENTSKKPGSHHSGGIINPGIIGYLKSYQPDAILIYGWAYKSHLKVIRYFKNKIPVFFRGDSTLLDDQGGFRSFLRWFRLKWVYSHIDGAFYVGTNNKAYFKKYGLKDKQLSFAPHAVDNERFGYDRSSDVLSFKKSLGIADDNPVILFAGKLEEKKSPELLLDAFLSLNHPGVHLIFAGDGILDRKLKEKASGNPNIHFVGFQNQSMMPVVYQSCDLFCLPSKGPGETWGLAVNEAMACGKAIIVSDKCGCAADLITEGNGIVFKSEDVNSLKAALSRLISSPELLDEYGKRSKKIISEWNFYKIAEIIEHQVLHGGVAS